MKKRMIKKTVKVEWNGINTLDLGTITEMWHDGYMVCINDGKIQRLLMRTIVPA